MLHILTVAVVLSALVLIHELGHLAVAKGLGIGVRVFSLGFGPRLAGWRVLGTEYRLSAFPFGGYVTFKEPGADDPAISGLSFEESPVRRRAMVGAAGPAANLAMAFFLCWGLFWANGIAVRPPVVGKVTGGSPAGQADVRPGDRMLEIAGMPISRWEDVVRKVAESGGRTLHMTVLRDGRVRLLEIAPRLHVRKTVFGEREFAWFIGIENTSEPETVHLNGLQAALEGMRHTGHIISLTVQAFVKLMERVLPLDAVGGPLMIVQAIHDHARSGAVSLLALTAVISVNLGLVNLLPLPVLDGGYLVLLACEGALGRPVPERVQKALLRAGLILLIAAMAWGTINDIRRL